MHVRQRTSSSISATPAAGAAHRRSKVCPLCGEKNFSRLSHHLTNVHHLDRHEIQALIAYTDQNNNNNNNNATHPHASMASVSSSSPTHLPPSMVADKSPQQTPISINTSNQQITSPLSSVSESDHPRKNSLTATPPTPAILTSSSSPSDQQLSNYLPIDGKKRLLCPRCDTWVLNLTDHLIKKHHLISKQERLPFLRLARNRCATPSSTAATGEKTPTNSFLISPDHSSSPNPNSSSLQQAAANKKYQNIVKKYRKKFLGAPQTPSSTSSSMDKSSSLTAFDHSGPSDESPTNHNLLTMNSIQSLLTNGSQKSCKQEKFKFPTLNESYSTRTFAALKAASNSHNVKDQQQVNRHRRHTQPVTESLSLSLLSQLTTHQKFEQRLTVFRQQFAVTLAMQNSLMQQMELLQRSFVCIEDEWNDMKKQIAA